VRICILLLLNLLFFFKTLTYKYVSDDLPSAKRPREPIWWKRWYYTVEGRARNYPQLDHFITTVVHALCAVGVYLAFGKNDISFLAAILFSFNPINNQVSVWISGRGYAMATLGNLWALSLPAISPVFLTLAAYYNVGFLFPVVFIGSSNSWMLVFMPLIWAYHFKRFFGDVKQKSQGEMFDADKKVQARRIIIALKTFGFYVTHALIPIKTTFYHSYMQSMAGSGEARAYQKKDRFLWIGIIAALAIWVYWTWTPWNMVSFALLWWVVGILPFLNIVRMQQEISERYCYAPLPGLMYVLSYLIVEVIGKIK
jgi:hypothetical protein